MYSKHWKKPKLDGAMKINFWDEGQALNQIKQNTAVCGWDWTILPDPTEMSCFLVYLTCQKLYFLKS